MHVDENERRRRWHDDVREDRQVVGVEHARCVDECVVNLAHDDMFAVKTLKEQKKKQIFDNQKFQ